MVGGSAHTVKPAPWERRIAVLTPHAVSPDEEPDRLAEAGSLLVRPVGWPVGIQSDASVQPDVIFSSEQTTPPDLPPPHPIHRPDPVVAPEPIGARLFSWTPTMRGSRGRGWRVAARSLTTLVAVAALALTGAGWHYLRATDKGFTKVQALDVGSHDIVDPGGQLGDENFLIAGTDSRGGVNGLVGAGTTADAEGARSDTVMLVNIPASRQRIVVVSFPRDLDVTRPVCGGWDNDNARYTGVKYPSAFGDKLNATYALGGPKCLTKVVQKLSGLKINHFIGLDFTGFESIVDTIGGVEVCTGTPIVDGQLGTVLAEPGPQVVTGTTALDYVRARHVIGEQRSDYDRIHRQQLFLSSLLRSIVSDRVLFDPGRLTRFITAFTGHTFMDNTGTQDLLMLGRSLRRLAADQVTFLTVPTAGTTSYGNEIPRETDIKAIFRAIIDDQPLPGEQRPPDPASSEAPVRLTAADPDTMPVQVSNASATSGLARNTAAELAGPGFRISSIDTYPYGTLSTTVVRYSAGHRAEAATVAAAIPGAKLQATTGIGSMVQVILGTDFSGLVQAPPPVGSPLPPIASAPTAPESPITLPADLEHVNAADDSCR
jgi:LCP family protein required for cell wall assembly